MFSVLQKTPITTPLVTPSTILISTLEFRLKKAKYVRSFLRIFGTPPMSPRTVCVASWWKGMCTRGRPWCCPFQSEASRTWRTYRDSQPGELINNTTSDSGLSTLLLAGKNYVSVKDLVLNGFREDDQVVEMNEEQLKPYHT